MPSGSWSWLSATSCLTALTVRMMSEDSFLNTSNEIAGVPFIRDRTLAGSKSSRNNAKSLTRMVDPPSVKRTMTSAASIGSVNSASVTIFFSLV